MAPGLELFFVETNCDMFVEIFMQMISSFLFIVVVVLVRIF